MNLNKCPHCQESGSLRIEVDAMDTNFEAWSEDWDTLVHYKLTEDLMVVDRNLEPGVETCDKDRNLICISCSSSSDSSRELNQLAKEVRTKNPGWI